MVQEELDQLDLEPELLAESDLDPEADLTPEELELRRTLRETSGVWFTDDTRDQFPGQFPEEPVEL